MVTLVGVFQRGFVEHFQDRFMERITFSLYGDVTLLKDLTNRSCSLLAVESSYKRPRNQTFCSCLCQRCNITNSSSSDE